MKKILALILCALFIACPLQMAAADVQTEDVWVEHLYLPKKVAKKAMTDKVKVSKSQVQVLPYNTIQLTFAEPFTSKDAQVGDTIPFVLNEGLRTQEGTEILPPGTKVVAEITGVTKPKVFNKSGKINLEFKCIEYPSGAQKAINARLSGKKDFLSRGKLNALGKGLGSTLGGMAIGTGAGCGIGVAAGAVIVGGFAIGMPVGFAVGAAAGLITPGLHYKAKAGDKVNIQLTETLCLAR